MFFVCSPISCPVCRWYCPLLGCRHSPFQAAAVWEQQEGDLQRGSAVLRRARRSLQLLPTSPCLLCPGGGPLVLGGERVGGRGPLEGGTVRGADREEGPEGQLSSGLQQLLLVPHLWQKEGGGAAQQSVCSRGRRRAAEGGGVSRLWRGCFIVLQRDTRGQSSTNAFLQAQVYWTSVPSPVCVENTAGYLFSVRVVNLTNHGVSGLL